MCISLVSLIFKEKIKAYFKKDLIKTQENYKMGLEAYKANLLQQLEEYKLDIDIRRNLIIEMSHNRLLAYQKTISSLLHFYRLLLQYNYSPSSEHMQKIFGQNESRGWKDLNVLEDNFLFLSQNLSEIAKEIGEHMRKILLKLKSGKPIESATLEKYSDSLKNLKNAMVSEIFPGDVKDKDSNN